MFNTICVGFDGSDHAENAVRVACDLAGKYGSAVHIIHTPMPETVTFALGAVAGYHVATTMPSTEETKKAATLLLDKAAKIATEAGQAEITTHVGTGDPAESLIEYTKAVGSDLVVTGRRGLGNLKALVLGSTSQSIAHLAPCAHLTVR